VSCLPRRPAPARIRTRGGKKKLPEKGKGLKVASPQRRTKCLGKKISRERGSRTISRRKTEIKYLRLHRDRGTFACKWLPEKESSSFTCPGSTRGRERCPPPCGWKRDEKYVIGQKSTALPLGRRRGVRGFETRKTESGPASGEEKKNELKSLEGKRGTSSG